ncbi:MAG TPA: zinc-binding dehydrogenase [Candidatus Acidoferrales bacterium]|nr:zinc-binding dehydrogenase [Candidatus Acidoferrales bacterium]
MKAVVFSKHGGPEVLRVAEVADPRPRGDEVLVRVRACSVNHLDLWVRRGLPGVEIPMPHIPGSDIAGEIAGVGELVTDVHVGEKVILAPGVSCGHCHACLAGDDNLCRKYTLLGYLIDGGCAELVIAPARNVFPMPETLSFEEAAAVPLVFLTAWHMLVTRAKLQPGEEVLILGGGSGVGSAGIQIAKMLGGRVIATVGGEEKVEKTRALGADHVVLHSQTGWQSDVKRLTYKHRGVDVVFEHVGTATWDHSLASLATGGRLVTCGATTGYDAKLDLRFLFTRHLSVLGSYMGSKAELFPVLDLVGRKILHPVIDSVLPLDHCAEAHARLERRHAFGKIVLKV